MSGFKEIKIPKYVKGMDYSDYIIQLHHVSSTGGRMKEAITSAFSDDMPPITGSHGQSSQD